MSARLCAVLLAMALIGAARDGSAVDQDAIEARRLAYSLADLEKRTGEMAVTQVTLRQQVLDAGPELSRKTCEQIAQRMKDPDGYKFLKDRVKDLEKRRNARRFDASQLERLSQVKSRLLGLESDASLDCKALAPINP
jgi:hypothetical protein